MAVINPYSGAVAQFAAENAIATRHEKSLMRESDADRQISDVEKRMAMEQIASSQRQTELSVNIAQKAGSAVQNGIQAGQKLGDVGEHVRINSQLHSGAAAYQQGGNDRAGQLLGTDLGNGQTVQDVLGTDAQGQRIPNDADRRATAERKLDLMMRGSFTREDLAGAGFSKAEQDSLLALQSRGSGNQLTTDEAVEYLFGRSSVVQQDQARDKVHKAVDMLIKDVLFVPSGMAAKIGQKAAKDAGKALEEDRAAVGRNRGTQSRMSWLATEQLNMAGQMVANKKDSTYKP